MTILLFAILNMARGAGAWDDVGANRITACLAMGVAWGGATWQGLAMAVLLWGGFLMGWSHAYMFGRQDDWTKKFKLLSWGDL
jgi:hypothetical protein